MADQKINFIDRKFEVLDAEKCNRCEYFEPDGVTVQVICGAFDSKNAIWPVKQVKCVCKNLERCKYLQKLFASETPSKVEESESDP